MILTAKSKIDKDVQDTHVVEKSKKILNQKSVSMQGIKIRLKTRWELLIKDE